MINVQVIGNTEKIRQTVAGDEMCLSCLEDEVQALNAAEKARPSIILLDYNLRKAETDDYIGLLLNVSADSKIIVIVDGVNEEQIFACLVAGAKGYQNINRLNEYAIKMIKVVDAGEAWVARRMVAKLLNALVQKRGFAFLAEGESA